MKSKTPLYSGFGAIIIALAAILNPDQPLSSAMPIVLGEDAYLFATAFLVVGFCLIYSYYKSL